jgi:hypothetical protein
MINLDKPLKSTFIETDILNEANDKSLVQKKNANLKTPILNNKKTDFKAVFATMGFLFSCVLFIYAHFIDNKVSKERLYEQNLVSSFVSAVQQPDSEEAKKEVKPYLTKIVPLSQIQWESEKDGQKITIQKLSKNSCSFILNTFGNAETNLNESHLSLHANGVVVTDYLLTHENLSNDVCNKNNTLTFEYQKP